MGAWIEINSYVLYVKATPVAPLVGAWIEICCRRKKSLRISVAPLVGAWIEIANLSSSGLSSPWSLPSWERGLKSVSAHGNRYACVAPLVGAWIEMTLYILSRRCLQVAPLVGAWIEIGYRGGLVEYTTSLPSWERGLKSGARTGSVLYKCRSPRGSVD